MKKIAIKNTENKYKSFLIIMKGLLNITDREIDLLVEFNKHNHYPIEDSVIKDKVSVALGITKKTLHIMLKNLVDKKILIKDKRNCYERTNYILFNDKIEISIV